MRTHQRRHNHKSRVENKQGSKVTDQARTVTSPIKTRRLKKSDFPTTCQSAILFPTPSGQPQRETSAQIGGPCLSSASWPAFLHSVFASCNMAERSVNGFGSFSRKKRTSSSGGETPEDLKMKRRTNQSLRSRAGPRPYQILYFMQEVGYIPEYRTFRPHDTLLHFLIKKGSPESRFSRLISQNPPSQFFPLMKQLCRYRDNSQCLS
jgi:hypothetical protein